MSGADDEVRLDHARSERLGFDEAVFCLNKTVDQIDTILELAAGRGGTLLLTRLDADKRAALARGAELDYDARSASAMFGAVAAPAGAARVAIVTAGTSDAGPAREAQRTLYYYGHPSETVFDVGVAGLWRLLERVDRLRRFPVVIAAAGMDAALPSVLGGLLPGVLIALPTSTGYGVAGGGGSALNAALASCAPGVSVVNIDNGYGAACAALRALRAIDHAGSRG